MAGRKNKLDPRKSIFISEILTGKSGAESAREAGIEKKNAARQAHRWQSEPEVAEEIEKGLAAIREGAEVDVASMIRQLDSDRQFAIKTENASAATRASELKAKLVGLMVERRDTRATVKTEVHSSRDTALAIMALFQDEGINFKISDPPPEALDVSGTDSWDASILSPENAPSQNLPEPSENAPSPKIGERVLVGTTGAWITLVEITGSGEKKWAVFDSAGALHSYKRERADAEEHAARLPGNQPKKGNTNE